MPSSGMFSDISRLVVSFTLFVRAVLELVKNPYTNHAAALGEPRGRGELPRRISRGIVSLVTI